MLMLTWTSFGAGQMNRQRPTAVTQMQEPATTLDASTQVLGSPNRVPGESKWPFVVEGKVVGEDGAAVWNASVLLQCGYKSQQDRGENRD